MQLLPDIDALMAWPTGTTGQYTVMGIPGHARASVNGHGTLEILEITQILEKAEIPCCIVGISACKYFGAAIMRNVSPSALPF